MTDTTARTPPGVPTGGQFTPTTHGEPSGVALLGDGLDDTETCRHCSADTSDGEGYDGYCGTCADLVSQHENGEHDGPADGDCPDCPDAVHVIDKLVILGDEQWRMDVDAKPRAGDTVLVKPVNGDEPTVRTVADVVSGPGAVVVVRLDDDPAGEPENVGGNEVTVLRPVRITDMSTPQRVAAGVPTGGQFAATGHGEATVTLPTLPVPPLREWHRDIISRIKRTGLDRDDTLLRDLVTDTAGVDALDRVDEGEYAPTAREQAEAHAAAVNNSSLAVQVHYLCDHLGTGEVDEAISRALAARYAEQAKPTELTPGRIARNTKTLDDLAHIFRDPDLGVGVLEDAAEMLRDGGVHVATEDELDDDAYEEIPEHARFTTQPGTPERDQEVLSALGWMYSKPEWDSDLIGWTSETLAHSGRDMTESEESTWGRH